MPVNYQLGKIYRIVNSENSIEYIGSTAQKLLSSRMSSHRSNSKAETAPLYTAMREIGVEKFKVLLIKNFPCGSKAELEAEEYKIIDELIAAGVEVYNGRIGGKHSPAARKKMADAKGGKRNPRFDFGCIGLYDNHKGKIWRFQYKADGKTIPKSFSVKKYGFWEAKALAEAERKAKYPEWRTDEELELAAFQSIEL